MASSGFKFDGNDWRKDKFGLNKLRSLFIGGSASSDHNIRSGHTPSCKKQGVGKSYSYNPVSAGHGEGLSRNKPFLSFSSSVPDRDSFSPQKNYQLGHYKRNSMQATPSHPALSFSKSLPGPAYNSHGNLSVGESKVTQTGGKLKLSRTARDTFAWNDDKLKRTAKSWRNDHDPVKKRKIDVNFNNQSFRNFHFDDEISLRSFISNPEDHIYEEIDSNLFTSCDEEENEVEENFLLGISLERRNNLKFYGSAGWDFGSGSYN